MPRLRKRCKNCGKLIQKVANRWYHVVNQSWYCSTVRAEPKNTELKKMEVVQDAKN